MNLVVSSSLAVIAAVLLVASGSSVMTVDSASVSKSLDTAQLGFLSKVNHVVFVVMENHAYDNLFGAYCLVASPVCPSPANGVPSGICEPIPSGGCIAPYNLSASDETITRPMLHDYNSSNGFFDGGKMDGFYAAQGGSKGGAVLGMGHYNVSTVPIYYDLAEHYSLSDDFFSSLLSYSLPNHWHIVAGASPSVVVTDGLGDKTGGYSGSLNQTVSTYLSQANNTTSIEDLLAGHPKVSWDYYDYPLGNWPSAIAKAKGGPGTRNAFDYWNPQAAKYESYTAPFLSHFPGQAAFFRAAAHGNLPDLSWVIPNFAESDHPPANVTTAESFVSSVVDAVEASPDWNSTVLYITWDDYGGFYDHVAPPMTSNGTQQLGFRVPLLVVSPYVKAGWIAHGFSYFESILHTMEWRFGLGCMTADDCGAPIQLGMFDFSAPARAPISFPTSVASATYPLADPPKMTGFSFPTALAATNDSGPDVD